jgi:starvation-inducible DNA-binding protein
MSKLEWTVPSLSEETSYEVIDVLQARLEDLNDLALLLKHAHWNVKGANFIAVHEMLDPQIDIVRNAVDEIAERVATLGGSPNGTADAIVGGNRLPKYALLKRADALEHLKVLNNLYAEVIVKLREGIDKIDDLDVISSNILQDHVQELEQFQWFIRSHIL